MFDFAALKSNSRWLLLPQGAVAGIDFLQQVLRWSRALPSQPNVVLLCKQHNNFITSFLAAQFRGQTVLLPSTHSTGAVEAVQREFPNSYCIDDEFCCSLDSSSKAIGSPHPSKDESSFNVRGDHVAALVFTSGSTGRPVPHEKTWSSLVRGAQLAQKRFGYSPEHTIIATVPAQHMYGLETCIMVPIVCGTRVFSGRPFFPEDIRRAMVSSPTPRILVTTPVHLRACVESNLPWPDTDFVISATAPISKQLVSQTEIAFNSKLFEIYGCTEAGSLASRQPAQADAWQLYDEFSLVQNGQQAIVSAPHISNDVVLSDLIDKQTDQTFLLRGRHSDMVNIAGKRASLGDLNLKLREIPGVIDGVFVVPDETEGMQPRLTALVVAPTLTEAEIMACLASQIDPAFMPRPLYRVDSLPQNELGKIPRKLLLALLERLERVA